MSPAGRYGRTVPFADLPDVRLFYTDDRCGDEAGSPLLLVHGWGADSNGWCFHLPELTRARRVIAVDLRGHGRSSTPADGYRPRDLATDLAALLDHLDVGPVVAIGHSMGGQVVTALAVEHAAHVRAVVVIDPAYGATGDEVAGMAQRLAELKAGGAAAAVRQMAGAFRPTTPPWLKTWVVRQMLGTAPHVLAQAYAGMYLEPDAFGVRAASEAYLARRRCPTLAVASVPEAAAWEARQHHHPLSTVVVWRDVGHYLHQERPDEFVAVVRRWLGEIDG